MQEKSARMGEFKASSGHVVEEREDGSVMLGRAHGYLSPHTVMDAEEFFQAKRDAELGRWRYPLNPHLVVYPVDAEAAVVVDETDGHAMTVDRDHLGLIQEAAGSVIHAARCYFEAHPVRAPWDEAERGDVWLFLSSGNGRAVAWRADRDWDVMDQMGHFHPRVDDVPAVLREAGYVGWEKPTAERIYSLRDAS